MNELLNQTLGKVNRNRNLYKSSEFAVRDHLLNPILTYLGWDVTDADFVIPNDTSEQGSVQGYALVKGGKRISFVEPKNISENLIDHIPSLTQHCQQEEVEFGILSTGTRWMLLKTFGTDLKPKDRIVWQIDLEHDTPMIINKRFKSIDYQNIERIEHLLEKEKILNDAWEGYLRNSDAMNSQIAELFISKISVSYPNIEFDGEDTKVFYRKKLKELIQRNNPLSTSLPERSVSRGSLQSIDIHEQEGEPSSQE
jgi:predicted type IV restriction endonuclease